jgi:hypothetical protein
MPGASAAGRLEPQMPLYAANPLVELAVVPRHSAGDLRQQLVDGRNVRPIDAAHVEIVAVVMRPGQALRVPRSPDLPCGMAC